MGRTGKKREEEPEVSLRLTFLLAGIYIFTLCSTTWIYFRYYDDTANETNSINVESPKSVVSPRSIPDGIKKELPLETEHTKNHYTMKLIPAAIRQSKQEKMLVNHLCVVSLQTNETSNMDNIEWWWSLKHLARTNREQYCKNNGYRYVEIDAQKFYEETTASFLSASGASVLTLLSTSCKYVLYVDPHTLFTNMSMKLDPIISRMEKDGYHAAMLKKPFGQWDTTVMLWRRAYESSAVLGDSWMLFYDSPFETAFNAVTMRNNNKVKLLQLTRHDSGIAIHPQIQKNNDQDSWHQGDLICKFSLCILSLNEGALSLRESFCQKMYIDLYNMIFS